MGFRTGSWATIWEKKMTLVEYYTQDGKKESFKKPQVRISISKRKNDGTYKQTFNGWVDIGGEALNELKGVVIKEGEPLHKILKDIDVENRCVANAVDGGEPTYTWYWTPTIWSFGKADEEEQNKKETVGPKPSAKVVEEDEDDLPF